MVGALIKQRRRALGWSQETLADKMDWKQTYLSRVERGEIGLPQRATLERLGDLLGLSLQEFYRAAGVLEDLPPEAMPPRPPQEEPSGDKDWDPAMLVPFVLSHPDRKFVARLERLAERVPPEAFERICVKIARAWLANGVLAVELAEEFIDLET